MNYQYQTYEQLIYSSELGRLYFTYGICCYSDCHGKLKAVKSIEDVSLDFEFVTALAKMLTAQQVDLVHFEDVVLDSI